MVIFPKYESYKESEVPDLSIIPEHWSVIRNRFLFKEQNERSVDGQEIHLCMSQKFGLIPSDDFEDKTLQSESYEGARLCEKGDLILNRLKAHLSVFATAPCDGLVSPDYSVFRLNDSRMVPKYFEHLFKTPVYLSEFNRRVRGIVAGFYRLYSGDFDDVRAICPPIEDQKRIVDFLDRKTTEIDQAIAQKQRLIELLQEQKAILINQAVTKELNPNVIMRDSDIDWIGKIPAHWRFPKLKYACRVIKDGLHLTPCKHNIGINFISTQHVRNRKITLDQATYISEKDYKLEHPKIKPEVGDVLITLVGSIGFAALVASDHMPLSCTRHVGYVRCREDLIKQEYLINYTESNVFKCFIEENVSQTAQPSIYLASLANHQLPLPPLSEQKEINGWLSKSITSLLKTIDIILSEIFILHELKQIYITEAVTGKIKV
jgi:type I restriction enzyme, S subunit